MSNPKLNEDSLLDRHLLDRDLVDEGGLLQASLDREDRNLRARRRLRFGWLAGTSLVGIIGVVLIAGQMNLRAEALPEVLEAEGWRLWKERRYVASEAVFEKAVQSEDATANMWNGLGWSRLNGGNADEALPAFEKAVELDPNHPGAINGVGQSLFAQGKYAAAIESFEKVRQTASAALPNLLLSYIYESRLDDAKKLAGEIKESKEVFGGLNQSTQSIVDAAIAGTLTDEMKKPRKLAMAGTSGNLTSKAWQLFSTGRPGEAEKLFRKQLEADPDDSGAVNGLAFSLLNLGKKTEAKSLFEKLLESEPEHWGAINGLARCLIDDQPEKAIELWKKTVEKVPGPSAATVGLAMHYMSEGQPAEAIAYLEVLVKAGGPQAGRWKSELEKARALVK